MPGVVKSGAFYVSLNPGPSNFAGEKCDPNYFVASYQNDAFHTAGGVAANELGYKRVVLLAPNYQAGRDAIEGFKRTYKGEVAAEIYTKLDQSDSRSSWRGCVRWRPTRSTSSIPAAPASTSSSSTRRPG